MHKLLTALLTWSVTALVPFVAAAETTGFEAKVAAVDLLDSKEVAAAIAECTAGADPAPGHVDVEVTVDDQGALQELDMAPSLGEETTQCIRDALAQLSYPNVAEGFTVYPVFDTSREYLMTIGQQGFIPQPGREWTSYPTFSEMETWLLGLESTYPGLVDVFIIGQSTNGRDLWVAKIRCTPRLRPMAAMLLISSINVGMALAISANSSMMTIKRGMGGRPSWSW